MTAPPLVLIGELDDWTPAAACRDRAAGETGAWESPHQPGDRLQCDDAATQARRVRGFFERTPGD